MTTERRRNPRIQIFGKLHGYLVALDLPVSVTEISLGGMSLDTTIDFPVGVIHEFRLTAGEQSPVVLKGRVMHCRRGAVLDQVSHYVVGVQFIDQDAGTTESVGALIDRIS
jgi:hypothetical protein